MHEGAALAALLKERKCSQSKFTRSIGRTRQAFTYYKNQQKFQPLAWDHVCQALRVLAIDPRAIRPAEAPPTAVGTGAALDAAANPATPETREERPPPPDATVAAVEEPARAAEPPAPPAVQDHVPLPAQASLDKPAPAAAVDVTTSASGSQEPASPAEPPTNPWPPPDLDVAAVRGALVQFSEADRDRVVPLLASRGREQMILQAYFDGLLVRPLRGELGIPKEDYRALRELAKLRCPSSIVEPLHGSLAPV